MSDLEWMEGNDSITRSAAVEGRNPEDSATLGRAKTAAPIIVP